MRNRRPKKIHDQSIPDFGELGRDIEVEDWEEMYDSDYEHDNEQEEDPQDFDLDPSDFERIAEDEMVADEEYPVYSNKRRRVATNVDA